MGSVKKSFPFWDFKCYNIAPTKWGWQPAFHGQYTEKCGLQNQRNTNDWIREIQNCTNQIRLAASWPIKFSHNRSELHKFANWNMTSTLYIVNNQMSTYVPKNYRLKYDEVWAGKYIINGQMSLLQSYPRLWYSFRKSCWAKQWKWMHLRLNQYLEILRQHFKSWKHLKRVALTIWDKRYFPRVYFPFKF